MVLQDAELPIKVTREHKGTRKNRITTEMQNLELHLNNNRRHRIRMQIVGSIWMMKSPRTGLSL